MEIKHYDVRELSSKEMFEINGGSKIGDALHAAWDAICYAVDWVVYKIEEWYYNKRQEYLNSLNNEVYNNSTD
jgi:hypothetical protein